MEIRIRRGLGSDADSAVEVLHRSISELCKADHLDDEQGLRDWLANKTAASWEAWVNRDDAIVLVAENAKEIVGIGMVDRQGEVLLNYVHPDARFSGISKALLSALEDEARAIGVTRCFLESTVTARHFYARCGYAPTAEGNSKLEKALSLDPI